MSEVTVAELVEVLADVGYDYGVCDACHGEVNDLREPGVICAWCEGRGRRLRRIAPPLRFRVPVFGIQTLEGNIPARFDATK